ncbi:1,4-dihydroxy-2-naphthoate octaprenyltransferase [Virgibacillus subterraneus]|uniref:1,4-dihydroxy-2-naphthoate octaprenyltransferase n=1 Tax=Virgibacillus subterraneus TaxID=621109 RepID=A0A1H9GG61_9BACI|nr:prenyltransferase [Virgibacillus subterraneus]SEQ49100.1 1,4-dihydroxy-2-naphthoate octaprenyltransferase [Virgibacillus subterraneus]
MNQSLLAPIKNSWILLRSIAVVSSSITTIVSTVLPIFLYYTVAPNKLLLIFLLLLFGAFLIHGVLTHVLNDFADYKSGTDQNSPAILSGGSRVIQTGVISASSLWLLGKWLILSLSLIVVGLIIFGYFKIALLLAIGLWGAISYSLRPIQLSYRPFIGEWLSMFPSVLILGLAGAWLTLDSIPTWALQNALINALFCLAWVMVHHIPDREADRNASPIKKTSVVWAYEKFGSAFSRLPALLYFTLVGLCAVWLGTDRIWAMIGTLAVVGTAIFLVLKMQIDNHYQVSAYEKIILILAMINGVWLGIFI